MKVLRAAADILDNNTCTPDWPCGLVDPGTGRRLPWLLDHGSTGTVYPKMSSLPRHWQYFAENWNYIYYEQ